MAPNQNRRRVLQTGSVLATTALAGCTSFLGSDDDPDAGPDSYGIQLLNEMSRAHTVTIEATRFGEDELVFEETVEIEAGEQTEWDEVFTGDQQQYSVHATLEAENFYTNENQNRATINVGTDVSPEIENIIVKVAPYFDTMTVWVNQSAEEP